MMRHRVGLNALTLIGAVPMFVSACGGGPTATPVYDPDTRALVRIDYDYNRDGIVDVRTFMKNGKPERLEGDADGDGRIDRWEYYDDAGELNRIGGSTQRDGREDTWAYPSGDDVRVEISTARDGKVDRREFYHLDVLVRTESDTDGDGEMDSWEEYADSRVHTRLIDEHHTGHPTRRLRYVTGGEVQVEVSADGREWTREETPAATAGRVP